MSEIVISGRLYDEAPPQRNNALPRSRYTTSQSTSQSRGTVDEILEQAEEALQRAEQALVELAREDMCNHVEMLSSR